ncbi:MAG: hypothetical protein SGPRY_005696, partial [Prymnesium sp.]
MLPWYMGCYSRQPEIPLPSEGFSAGGGMSSSPTRKYDLPPPKPKQSSFDAIIKTVKATGGIPIILLIFVPRLCISSLVVGVAMMSRAIARLFNVTSSYQKKANLRILIVTDYMPPQTHGIAIRFRQYIDHMRSAGHEVQVFSTDAVKERESSFDHPNLPSITNPYNIHNRMAYNPGIKLAWYLGELLTVQQTSMHRDLCLQERELTCSSAHCGLILGSHHVDMEYYVKEYVRLKPVAALGGFLYYIFAKLPAIIFAMTNAAPTLCFLKNHMPNFGGIRSRIPTGVAESRFKVCLTTYSRLGNKVRNLQQLEEERRSLLELAGYGPDAGDVCILIMDTIKCLQALVKSAEGKGSTAPKGGKFSLDGERPTHVVIAGHGPSRGMLEEFAARNNLPVTFLGNVAND